MVNVFERRTISGCDTNALPLAQPQIAKLGPANSYGVFQHGLEYRFQLSRGARYNLKHFGCGGLLPQRLAQLREQAGVLNGDNGLRGEVLD